jgi:NAD(P)-dependent dehydrogenase (short-subunit alcohol dehydrogenase family)
MLLEDENAVIYGGGGNIGGAVAREFSREGARVFLVGRTYDLWVSVKWPTSVGQVAILGVT